MTENNRLQSNEQMAEAMHSNERVTDSVPAKYLKKVAAGRAGRAGAAAREANKMDCSKMLERPRNHFIPVRLRSVFLQRKQRTVKDELTGSH